MNYELIATATFGLEAVVRREIEGLGYKIIKTEDGKVTFLGDERAIVRSNLWLRCADRVLLKTAEFTAVTFEELFQGTKAYPWEEIIPIDGEFTVTCSTVKSKLHNPPAIQSIAKKAIVERMRSAYGIDRFPETGAAHTVKVTILKDRVTLTVDTSGTGLHKRGYRVAGVEAPIKETLAAALVKLSFFGPGRILIDPCCGSGTIPIEAALIARNIAPGCNRDFAAEKWKFIDRKLWIEERLAARDGVETDSKIYAYDINPKAVEAARQNALEAGVDDIIEFARLDARKLKAPPGDRGMIVTNPPYGERIGEREEIDEIYGAFGRFFRENPDWSLFIITPDREIERKIAGRRADRRRKLYNGSIETTYYQFHGRKQR